MSATGRARAAVALLGVMIGLEVVGACLEYPLMRPFLAEARGEALTDGQLIAVGLTALGYVLVYFAAFIATVVAYCMWVHRAHRNLRALGVPDLVFTPGWAVGWYFVPIMNLFRPCQAMAELWRASTTPPAPDRPAGWKETALPGLVGVWWGAYVLSGVLTRVSMRLGAGDTPGILTASVLTSIVASLAMIVAGVAVIRLIRRIDQAQERQVAARVTVPVAPRAAA
jgi:hypothetical protein